MQPEQYNPYPAKKKKPQKKKGSEHEADEEKKTICKRPTNAAEEDGSLQW